MRAPTRRLGRRRLAGARSPALLPAAALAAVGAAAGAPEKSVVLAKVGDGQCNGGVGGTGEHKCLLGGACNEGGTPLADPTADGTGCPGEHEYLLCKEDASITREVCQAACASDPSCVGFLVSSHAAKGQGRCELHTKEIKYSAKPLECFGYKNGAFSLIGKGACRTKLPTVSGPQNGTHYGDMRVKWVDSFDSCKDACRNSNEGCVGVEYHPTANTAGKFKCEVHLQELSADQMSTFECWANRQLTKVGDGQCNGGVGGTGEHKCLIGGACNEGGTPAVPPTHDGTGCPGEREYLLCTEDTSVNYSSCQAACLADSSCVGFLVSNHAAKGSGRCELHTKAIEYAAKPLECYTYVNGAFTLIGKGACRTKAITVSGPQNGTHYGFMSVAWVQNFEECKEACRKSQDMCVGVEYHPTARASGEFKCEVHFEELSAEQMSTFECWNVSQIQPTVPEEETTPEPSSSSMWWLLPVFGAIILLIAGAFGIHRWRRAKSLSAAAKQEQASSLKKADPSPDAVGQPTVADAEARC